MVFVLSQLHFLAALLYLTGGTYTLLQDRQARANRLFFLLSLCFTGWAVANGLAITAPAEETAWKFFHLFSPFWFLFPVLLLHFSLRLIHRRLPFSSVFLPAFYLPGALLFLLSGGGTEIIASFPSSELGRYIVYEKGSPLFYLNVAYYSLYVLITICLYARWYRRSRNPRQRKQALLILLSLFAGGLLASFFGTLLPILGITGIPPVAPLCMLVWAMGMSVAVGKYRLMRLSPDIAAATILRYIRDFVLLCNEEEEIVHLNTKLAEALASSPLKQEGKPVSTLFPFLGEQSLAEFLGTAELRERETELINAEGESIPVFLTVMRMKDEHGGAMGFVLVSHDLRPYRQLEREKEEHRKTSEQLKRSEETFSKAFQASPVGMAIIDTHSNVIEQMNDSAMRILAYDDSAFCSTPSSDQHSFLTWVAEEDEELFTRSMERSGTVYGMKSELYRCDGNSVEVLISADKINIEEENKMLFCFSDLTRTNRLERELITMQKFESIGLLAGGIAHDFNNLLTAIMGNVSLAKESTSRGNTAAREALELALAACNHASQLTGQLLTFSKSENAHSAPVSVNDAVKQSVNLALSGTEIELVLDDSDMQLQVLAEKGELVQIFNNLLINAKQAMTKGGSITITVRRYQHPEGAKYAAHVPISLPEGEYVRVAIHDTGTGIPRSRVPHLFDPYFTTKPSGSGLGLSIVYSLVKKYRGEITVYSRKGEGSTFTVFLPAIRAEDTFDEELHGGEYRLSGTVMLMDDEEVIRQVGSQLLSQLGLTVYTAAEGEELLSQLRRLKERGEHVDAVILDLTVPSGIHGLDTAEGLRALLPSVPIILTTGYASHELLGEYSAHGFNDYLIKPFSRRRLAETLARHLGYEEERDKN